MSQYQTYVFLVYILYRLSHEGSVGPCIVVSYVGYLVGLVEPQSGWLLGPAFCRSFAELVLLAHYMAECRTPGLY